MTAPGRVRSASERLAPAALGRSVGLTCAVLGVAGLVLRVAFRGPGAGAAIAASAGIALAVQLVSCVAARAASPGRLLAVWLGSAFVRLLTLAGYGFVVVRMLGFPPPAALLSLATFFFVTTLAESRLHLR